MLVSVHAREPSCLRKARELAEKLELPFKQDAEFSLLVSPERLELHEIGETTGAIYADFLSGKLNYRLKTSGKKQPLARAVGIKASVYPSILDASAGLGQDAFVLASLGCKIVMLERSLIVAELLKDALDRASCDTDTASIVGRMILHITDAATFLSELTEVEKPDVIYFDPMYPESGKSAAKKKEMRLFRKLVGDDVDAFKVLELALEKAKKRVVVKRPQKAVSLGNRKPSAVISGKTTRFDIYLV